MTVAQLRTFYVVPSVNYGLIKKTFTAKLSKLKFVFDIAVLKTWSLSFEDKIFFLMIYSDLSKRKI